MGIPRDRIVYPNSPGYHTREETDSFIDLAQERGWRSAVVVGGSHQMLRIMLGTVKVMSLRDYWIEIYGAHPPFTRWQDISSTNQGLVQETRLDNARGELERIQKYQESGDIASLSELLDYMKNKELGLLDLGKGSRRIGQDFFHTPTSI